MRIFPLTIHIVSPLLFRSENDGNNTACFSVRTLVSLSLLEGPGPDTWSGMEDGTILARTSHATEVANEHDAETEIYLMQMCSFGIGKPRVFSTSILRKSQIYPDS